MFGTRGELQLTASAARRQSGGKRKRDLLMGTKRVRCAAQHGRAEAPLDVAHRVCGPWKSTALSVCRGHCPTLRVLQLHAVTYGQQTNARARGESARGRARA